jgi:ABC-type histidine transport system ATPase subunit
MSESVAIEERSDAGSASPVISGQSKLQVTGLRKSFGSIEVLKGVSMAAREHDVIAVLGASGSGKSTFLRCINYLESPTAGQVSLNGETIRVKAGPHGQVPADAGQIARMRTRLAMVFQSFNLWSHMTVLENVIEAPVHVRGKPRREAVERAEALLHKVGIHAQRDAYPERLSGGQQQRAAIARALAVDPEVILFDEPTSALDPELVNEVLAIIRQLAREGRTMIIVTHELGFAREVSNRVAFFHGGRIEEEGDTDGVMRDPQSPLFRRFLASARH